MPRSGSRPGSSRSTRTWWSPATGRCVASSAVFRSRVHMMALDATQRLEAGLVQVNQNLVVQANMSYGGVKQSGLGKEASLESMLEHFTQKKTIILNLG